MEGWCIGSCFFRLAFFYISLSLSSEGVLLCLGILYWQVVFTPPVLFLFFFFSLSHSSHYSLSFSISAAFHHLSPVSNNIHLPSSVSALNLCLSFPLSSISSLSLPYFLLLIVLSFSFILSIPLSYFDSRFLIFTKWPPPLTSSSLAPPSHNPLLKTPQPCRPPREWTTPWLEAWWL